MNFHRLTLFAFAAQRIRLTTLGLLQYVTPTVQFAIFYPLVLGISWLLMPRPTLWKPFILVASYIFYAYANWKFCLLLGGGSAVAGGACDRESRASRENAWYHFLRSQARTDVRCARAPW